MDCTAFCATTSYQIKDLFEHYRKNYQTSIIRDVVHVEIPLKDHIGYLFFFSYGVLICWGFSLKRGFEILEESKQFTVQNCELESDEFTYLHGDALRIHEDEIILPDHDLTTKLAISHGIAQSVKLATFEVLIQKTMHDTRKIPDDLAQFGKISLSRKEIRRKMGQLFIDRNSINLHTNVLDVPEFFWEHPEVEPYYKAMANYLDIQNRVEILNHRLDVIKELFEMLGNELNHQHSSRLEWTIVWLIVIEVIISMSRDVFQII